MFSRALIVAMVLCAWASGAVHRIHIEERSDVLDGKPFGSAGPYERLIAKAHFLLDPKLPANRIITDIDKAPLNENGMVEFSADLFVLKPTDPAKGNGTLLFEVSNRGRKGLLNVFNLAAASLDPRTEREFGDGLLMTEGYTVAWLGWQPDLVPQPNNLRLYGPRATGIRGTVRSEYIPAQRELSFRLSDRDTHVPYEYAGGKATMTVRERADGPRTEIPKDRWSFAREENGKPVPDNGSVYMAAGFEPGKLYEVVYESKDPWLIGLGPAAIRDLISYLKTTGGPFLLGDQRRFLKRAIGFGTSQSARFLRLFAYQGFNADEKGVRVFDGLWPHVAGASRGSFNHRFAQPSRDAHPFMNTQYPTVLFPYTDLEQKDPQTGASDGLLLKAIKADVVPKIFHTNGSYEYYGRAAALIHASLDGKQDAPLAKDSRVYLIAGAQHGPGQLPPGRSNTQNLHNINDFRDTMRALLFAFNGWLKDGKEPPPSVYPLIGKDQLVTQGAFRFPAIPGVKVPTRLQVAYRMDFGPEFATAGIVSKDPPEIGKPYPTLLPQVDQDGNETSGIRRPPVTVPLGTLAGWNLRDPKIGAPDEIFSMVGSFIPFAKTKAERETKGDPRLSIEERYKSRDEYLAKVRSAAGDLVKSGYLLERDIPAVLERSGREWDYVMNLN